MWPPGRIFTLPEGIFALLLGCIGFFSRIEVEEKEAARTVTGAILWGIEVVVEGRRRHLKPLGTDIVGVGAANKWEMFVL
jgi:hypothetical protein